MTLIRIGGGKEINHDFILEDVAELAKNERVILVHGANFQRNELAQKLGIPVRLVTLSSGKECVFTDEAGIGVFLMSYAGLVNKRIVAKLQRLNVNAVGICGIDGKIWMGQRSENLLIREGSKTKLITGNFGGRVNKINPHLISLLLDNGYLPVICPPALSDEGEIINVDNDIAVALMAKEMDIKKIIFLIEAPGFLKNAEMENTIIRRIEKEKIDDYIQFAGGRMKKKLMGIKMALNAGVEKIYISDGRVKNPIKRALEGEGTIIC